MLRYTLNRLLQMIPTLIGVAVLVFFLLRIVPGDVVEVKLRGDGGNVSQEMIDMERKRLGLDKPMINQFADWMIGLATLDLGKSMWTERPVMEEIGTRLELSMQVAIMATIIAVLIAIPLGNDRGAHARYLDRLPGAHHHHRRPVDPVVLVRHADHAGIAEFLDWLPPITFTPFYVDPLANLAQLIWPALAVGYRYRGGDGTDDPLVAARGPE